MTAQVMKKKSTEENPAGIYELLGLAVGCIGMSHDDFCKCTFIEFESICRAWRDMTEGRSHDAWDRTRTVAAICIQPHVKRRITPHQLLPLPWDNKPIKRKNTAPELTPEEKQKRFEKITKRLGGD